ERWRRDERPAEDDHHRPRPPPPPRRIAPHARGQQRDGRHQRQDVLRALALGKREEEEGDEDPEPEKRSWFFVRRSSKHNQRRTANYRPTQRDYNQERRDVPRRPRARDRAGG